LSWWACHARGGSKCIIAKYTGAAANNVIGVSTCSAIGNIIWATDTTLIEIYVERRVANLANAANWWATKKAVWVLTINFSTWGEILGSVAEVAC